MNDQLPNKREKIVPAKFGRADEISSIQIAEVRNHMDRALDESSRGEGIDGEEFMRGMIADLAAGNRRKL